MAFGVEHGGQTIRPAWVATGNIVDPVYGASAIPGGVASLDELEARILARLPDTAMPASGSPLPAAGLALTALGLFATWRRVTQERKANCDA